MISIQIKSAGYEDKVVLKSISIEVEAGEKIVILGESGSGKSTLIKTVCGLHTDYSGSVEINGEAITSKGNRIAYMPQKNSLLPWLTVYENIISLRKTKDKSFDQKPLLELLRSLEIYSLKDKYPSRISGGEQQRAALASVIFFEPEIVLMDEPFSALDEVTRESIQLLFCELQKKYGFTVLFVTHSIEEALLIADKIIVLSKSGTVCHSLKLSQLTPWSSDFYEYANNLRGVIRYEKK